MHILMLQIDAEMQNILDIAFSIRFWSVSQNFWDPYNLRRLPELPSEISSFWLYPPYIFDSLGRMESGVVICVFKV